MKQITSVGILFLLFIQSESYGQVLNTWESNKSGIYYHSLDTLIKIVKSKKKINKAIVAKNRLPEHKEFSEVNGVQIEEMWSQDFKSKNLSNDQIYIWGFDLEIDQGKIRISYIVLHRPKDLMQVFHGGNWIFVYEFQSDSKTYRFTDAFEGSVNVHYYGK